MFSLISYMLLRIDWASISATVTALVAITVSLIALRTDRTMARRNIRLSIQQTIFNIVSEKARDCNAIWDNDKNLTQPGINPHFKVVSELIISKEVIEKSFYLFKKNYLAIIKSQDDFYFLLWKQLRTDLRQFIRKDAPELANKLNDQYYSAQVKDLHSIFKNHFES